MKLTNNIDLRELVPKSIWVKHGPRSVRFLNARLIQATQWLINRFQLESVYFNTWLYGGDKEQRGLRITGQKYYRGDGLHDGGNALDFVPVRPGMSLHDLLVEIHLDAAQNPELYFEQGIWRIESLQLATTWIHLDAMYWPDQHEVVFIDLTNRFTASEYLQQLISQGYELPNSP